MKRGAYIVIDGLDGSGKGEVFRALAAAFASYSSCAPRVEYIREPGGTEVGENIRNLILYSPMDPVTEFFLFLAQRKEVRNVVAERLVQGMNVISDRSDSSTFAFQICGRGLSNLTTFFFHSMKFFDPKPDLYIILDVPAEVAKERITKRAQEDGKTDRIDNEALEFHTRVRNGFYLFRDNIDVPCAFVDATRSPHVVAAEVVNLVSRVLVKVSS